MTLERARPPSASELSARNLLHFNCLTNSCNFLNFSTAPPSLQFTQVFPKLEQIYQVQIERGARSLEAGRKKLELIYRLLVCMYFDRCMYR